jgi:tetratricopeptide (TPR) repeat protein
LPELTGPAHAVWLARLERDHDNARAALQWARARGEIDLGLRLAGALWRFWEMHGHLSEGRGWLEHFLVAAGCTARSAARSLEAPRAGVASALFGAGVLAFRQGDYARAIAHARRSLSLNRQRADRRGMADALHLLGIVAIDRGRFARALALQEAALALRRQCGDMRGIGVSLTMLGLIARARGDQARAAAFFAQSVALLRQLQDGWGLSLALTNDGDLALDRGEYRRAATLYAEALSHYHTVGNRVVVAYCLEGIAALAQILDQPTLGALLFGAAEALRAAINTPLPPSSRASYDRALAALRGALDPGAYASSWHEGAALSLDAAIDAALALAQDACASPRGRTAAGAAG